MSARQIRKALGKDALVVANLSDDEIDTSDVRTGATSKNKSFNVFNLLNDSEDIDEDVDESQKKTSEDEKDPKNVVGDQRKKIKKKKKSSKKNQEKKINPVIEDDVDGIVRKVNDLLGDPQPSTSQNVSIEENDTLIPEHRILAAELKHLNYENEVIQKYGISSLREEQKHNQRSVKRYKRLLRKTNIISYDFSMGPAVPSGIFMCFDENSSDENNKYFYFKHSNDYSEIQKEFLRLVNSKVDINEYLKFIRKHHYHTDCLLQLAHFAIDEQDITSGCSFIKTAIFYLEHVFHSKFNLSSGKCRLDYKRQENRAFYIAIFRYLILMGNRTLYRTSLELCKLLLSLSQPLDPLAVILMLDFYAIKSEQYEWFIEFCDLWQEKRNLSKLPNIAFGLALSHFHVYKKLLNSKPKSEDVRQKNEKIANEHKKIADELLQTALIRYPGVLLPLLEAIKMDPGQMVLSNEYFQYNAKLTTSGGLQQVQELFINRSYHVWKNKDVLLWLENQYNAVIARINVETDYINEVIMQRHNEYRHLPLDIKRHLVLSGLTPPRYMLTMTNEIQEQLAFDPYPPKGADVQNTYTYPPERPTESVSTETRTNSSILTAFLASLIAGTTEGQEVNGPFQRVFRRPENLLEENDVQEERLPEPEFD
ncbi:hypothetical protein TKK_0018270 [Trichogramma kaykai]|uniref:Transcription factor 25 n=1 Tax=Trichogramma kaykai TaxID=54128 RepID=A0ABD2VZ00_9HYME